MATMDCKKCMACFFDVNQYPYLIGAEFLQAVVDMVYIICMGVRFWFQVQVHDVVT